MCIGRLQIVSKYLLSCPSMAAVDWPISDDESIYEQDKLQA